ncbi:MAG: 16S rRNA (guanine(527)-N(7))-methyltransferase RsmG [Acidobacteriia bacterium]|nr:16S rRNA (guanine(527)-N(7))-methyltransferase RsmG [Terriglobia bacterium]
MDTTRIAELLQPFLTRVVPSSGLSLRAGVSPEESAVLSAGQLGQISTYIDLLLRWNARINLTAVRQPEEIVTRHFGESLFAARCLFQETPGLPHPARFSQGGRASVHLIDVGSGAGFPGLPIKIWVPDLHLTLIESNQKKATFLCEVSRSITLTNIDVFSGRAESYTGDLADVVALRAVERFDITLPVAARLVARGGRLALLIGASQAMRARDLAPELVWAKEMPVPLSSNRILLLGTKAAG